MIYNSIVIFLALGLGGLWGISEGMTMVQFSDPRWKVRSNWEWGIRSHEWFGVYHLIDSAVVALGMTMAWRLTKHWPGWWMISGMIFAGWEMKEAGYSFARWGTIVAESENLNLFDVWERSLSRIWSVMMHWGRAIAAIILIWKGFVR